MTEKKKRKKATATDKADVIFSRMVRLPGRCYICGSTEYLQCAHGFSRRYRSTRWDFRNAFPLCRKCHVYFTHRPLEWDDWLLNEWGDDLYGEIRRLALSTEKVDADEVLTALRLLEKEAS